MELTELLQRLQDGDKKAMQVIMPLVYGELKKLASANLRRQSKSMPLETTALVHETFLKLARGRHPSYENRSHFYGIASRVMRQVLVDMARAMAAEKRGPGQEIALGDLPDRALQPDRSLLAVDEALNRLEKIDPFKAQVIDLRYFRRHDGGGVLVGVIDSRTPDSPRTAPGTSLAAQGNCRPDFRNRMAGRRSQPPGPRRLNC